MDFVHQTSDARHPHMQWSAWLSVDLGPGFRVCQVETSTCDGSEKYIRRQQDQQAVVAYTLQKMVQWADRKEGRPLFTAR